MIKIIFILAIYSLLVGCMGQYKLNTLDKLDGFNKQVANNNFIVDKIISIYDGDTIRVNIKADNCHPLLCKNIAIRLKGIDTPEIRGKCSSEKRLAKEARETLKALLKPAKIIYLKQSSRGKYFRIVAKVYADEVDVAQVLLDKKLAYRYDGGRKQSWCVR